MAGSADIDYEVYRLLQKRITPDSQVEYLVRWKGFTSAWDTWEPADGLQNCGTKITNFEKKAKKVTHDFAKKLVNRSKLTKRDVSQLPNQVPVQLDDQNMKHSGMPPKIKKIKRGPGRPPSVKKKPEAPVEVSASPIGIVIESAESTDTEIRVKPKSKTKNSLTVTSKADINVNSSLKKTPKSVGRPKKFKKNINGKLVINENLHNGVQKKRGRKKKELKSFEGKTSTGLKKISVSKKKMQDNSIKSADKKLQDSDFESIFQAVLNNTGSRSDEKDSVTPVSPKKKQLENETPKLKKINKKVNVKYGFKMSSKNDTEQYNSKGTNILSLSDKSKLIKHKRTSKSPNNKTKGRFKVSISRLIGAPKVQDKKIKLDKSQQSGDDTTPKRSHTVKKRKSGTPATNNKVEALKKTDANVSDSDDEVLYSLASHDVDFSKTTESNKVRSKSDTGLKRTKKSPSSGIKKVRKTHSAKDVHTTQTPAQQKIRLLDSIRQTADKPVRPVSPTPLFTNVKMSAATATVLPSAQPTAQPQWQVGQESPTEGATQEQADLPLSPATMSYKVLLENLPRQLHPKKAAKKTSEDLEEDVERRISVRATECAFKYKEILIKKCQKYTQIWLNTHTKMKNALNPLVIQEISSALSAAKYDDSNLVMLSGLGNVFCSGIDLNFLTTGDKRVAARQMSDALRDLIRKFTTFPKLIVAVVTGPAIGLGTAILPLCDIVYASDKASFSLPYGQLAQTPEGCSSYTLPQCCGVAMASELLVGGRKITAIEACQLGLVSQVYWPTSMMQEVIPRVQNMALLSGKALETTKLLIRSHQRTKLDLTNESECNLLVERWPTAECQRAMEEFLRNEKNYLL